MLKRKEIRGQFLLKGDEVEDCLLSGCCPCCSLIQQEKEVLERQQALANTNNTGNVIDQRGYVLQESGMVMPPVSD
jgi:PLAC8 family